MPTTIARRSALRLAGAAVGSGAITGFPTIWAQNIKNVTLRQFGTGVSNLNAVAEKVKAGPRLHPADDGARHRRGDAEGGDAAEILRHRRHRVFRHQEGVPDRRDAADGCQEDQATTTRSCRSSPRKLTPDSADRAGHRAVYGRLRRGPERQDLRQGPDRLDDADPDHLQRRHAGHPPRPGRPADHATGRTWSTRRSRARPSILNIPVDRHHGRGDGHGVAGHAEIRRQGQHDEAGDRQDDRLPDRDQEGRPVPRLLEKLRRERQPDGLGRGDHPVDVVAGGGRGAVARASPAPTSRWRKATAPGPAGWAWPST